MSIRNSIVLSTIARSCLPPLVYVVAGAVCVRDSLHALIAAAGWQSQSFAFAEEFLSRPRSLVPNCLIIDVQLPDLSGLDMQQKMAGRPESPIIFTTSRSDVPVTVRAMKAGAFEVLPEPFEASDMLRAMRDAVRFSTEVLARESVLTILSARYASLSARERQVMGLVIHGYLNKQVGIDLEISEITVKAHRRNMMRKMGATSLAQLVSMATRLDLIDRDNVLYVRRPGVTGETRAAPRRSVDPDDRGFSEGEVRLLKQVAAAFSVRDG
jgi:FixJ family two-component response regulator